MEKLAKEDKRLRIFNKKNEGVSEARNYGVKQSVGSFVMFVDVDDYIDEKYIERMYSVINKTNADVVCSGYCEYDKGFEKKVVPQRQTMEGSRECYGFFLKSKNDSGELILMHQKIMN